MVWCFVWNQCSKHKPRGSFVNTPALHSSLFFAIRDNARNPRYIETLPRRGYRFLVPVEGLQPPRRLMLAVLGFDNLSGNPQEDYFCEGLTEEIITEVACLNGEKLGVIARTSVSRFKDEKKTFGRSDVNWMWITSWKEACGGKMSRHALARSLFK